MASKADYVRAQSQTRNHTCHWPGCERQVPPAMWGCKSHWFALPAPISEVVWIGQGFEREHMDCKEEKKA